MDSMYAISEMAHLFGISRQTLIYYDRIGLFRPAMVNDEGYRFYAPTQIPYLRLICLLKDMGIELKEIAAIVESHDVGVISACLTDQRAEVDARIRELERRRGFIEQRRSFYDEAAQWQAVEGRPIIRHYPKRYVVFEPWDADGSEMTRSRLHLALAHAISRLRSSNGAAPVAGWGTVVRHAAFDGQDVFEGAGSFVTVPEGVDPVSLSGVIELPEGEYVCQSRWGMPYDPTGLRTMLSWMEEHRFEPAGDAFDFCLLDTTSYNERHSEDFCCMQVPLAF